MFFETNIVQKVTSCLSLSDILYKMLEKGKLKNCLKKAKHTIEVGFILPCSEEDFASSSTHLKAGQLS